MLSVVQAKKCEGDTSKGFFLSKQAMWPNAKPVFTLCLCINFLSMPILSLELSGSLVQVGKLTMQGAVIQNSFFPMPFSIFFVLFGFFFRMGITKYLQCTTPLRVRMKHSIQDCSWVHFYCLMWKKLDLPCF